MRIRRRTAAIAAAALTAVALAGCGSSGSPAASAGGDGSASDIPVGVIGSYSGTEAAYLQGSDKVAQAGRTR
jgi:hypothetical protein